MPSEKETDDSKSDVNTTTHLSSTNQRPSVGAPVGLTRLRILSREVDHSDYEKIMNLAPLPRIKKIYELTRGKVAPSASAPSPNEDYDLYTQAQSMPEIASAASSDTTNLKHQVTNKESLLYTDQNEIESYEPQNTSSRTTNTAYAGITGGATKSQKAQNSKMTSDASSPLHQEREKRNSEDILPLYRDDEQDEYDQVFDLNTTKAREGRTASAEQRKQQMASKMKEIALRGERKTGYLSTEQEAKVVRKAMVAVQYEEDGKFVPIPESFDPQKDRYHMITLDTRLLFEDSPRARANEMVDLLFRVRAKEGDAQSILDMTDKAERRRLIKLYTKGRTYANTPISLPTSGLSAHVIRHASPEYVNATQAERNDLGAGSYSDSNNVISDSRNPYVYIKSIDQGSATYNVNANGRIEQGYDIQSPMGSSEKLEDIPTTTLQWFSITQALHGGKLDWSLPEFVDEKGDVIHPHVEPLAYAIAAKKYLNNSVQAILHEVYHHRTNSPILFKQEKVKDENGVERIVDTNMTKAPGVHPSIHAAYATEMLNATHALKQYVRENFPNETLHNIGDFDFLYDTLWNPRDNSAEAARIRASIPRDARILFTVYGYMDHQDNVSVRIHNLYIKNRDAIMKKHPEIKTANDIYREYPKLMEIFNNGTKEQRQAVDKTLNSIIQTMFAYSIDNTKNRRELFRKWFSDNAAFEQASLPRRDGDNMA